MSYVKPPLLPEKDLPLPFEDVLGYHLHSELLEHRENVAKFDLSGFEGDTERSVEVTFGGPRWQMKLMAEPIIEYFVKLGNDQAFLEKTAEETITDFIEKSKGDGWTAMRKHGDVTVHFNEAIGAEKSPANPEQNLTKDLFFGDDLRFASIDGRGITSSDMKQLANSLPSAVKWLDSVKTVEKDGVMDFHPVVMLVEETNVMIHPGKILFIGGQLLSDPGDQGMMTDILRHERGHVINGDHDFTLMKTKVFQRKLGSVNYIYDTLGEIQEYIDNPLKIEGMDHEKTLEGIRAWGDELVKAMDQVSVLAKWVRTYKWGGEKGSLAIAADMDNETSFLKHLSHSPEFDLSNFIKIKNGLLDSVDKRKVASQTDVSLAAHKSEKLLETRQVLMEQVSRITPQHRADIVVADQAFQDVCKAREHLADIHAAQHSEDPRRLHKVFDKLDEIGFTGGRTHPENPERVCNASHFADRVLFQREQAAKETKDGQSR